jgi:hypothetical protein
MPVCTVFTCKEKQRVQHLRAEKSTSCHLAHKYATDLGKEWVLVPKQPSFCNQPRAEAIHCDIFSLGIDTSLKLSSK